MKHIITAANNLVELQKRGKDIEAKTAFLLFKEKDKKAIVNTIDILHGAIFSQILTTN